MGVDPPEAGMRVDVSLVVRSTDAPYWVVGGPVTWESRDLTGTPDGSPFCPS